MQILCLDERSTSESSPVVLGLPQRILIIIEHHREGRYETEAGMLNFKTVNGNFSEDPDQLVYTGEFDIIELELVVDFGTYTLKIELKLTNLGLQLGEIDRLQIDIDFTLLSNGPVIFSHLLKLVIIIGRVKRLLMLLLVVRIRILVEMVVVMTVRVKWLVILPMSEIFV